MSVFIIFFIIRKVNLVFQSFYAFQNIQYNLIFILVICWGEFSAVDFPLNEYFYNIYINLLFSFHTAFSLFRNYLLGCLSHSLSWKIIFLAYSLLFPFTFYLEHNYVFKPLIVLSLLNNLSAKLL